MPPQRCTAKLAEKIQLNAKFTHFYFEYVTPPSIEFKAGQYVSMEVSPRGDRRSYSICSTPATPHGFELLVDLSPQGVGSQFLEKLPFGQEVPVLSPLGVFTVYDGPEEESVSFVATGAGIAPFRGMILDQLQNKHDTRDITLYWGLREVEHLFWQDEFAELADSFPNFHFHPTLSRPPVEWPLCRGRVTNCLSVHALLPKAGYYICGNRAMVEEVSTLLKTQGVDPTHIHHENFY